MATDLLSFAFKNKSFSLKSLNLGPVSTNGWAIIGVRIQLQSKLFKNQREDGSYIVDGRVILPRQITVTVVAQTQSAVELINEILKDRKTIYTVTTRGLVFESMTLQSQGLNQDADNITSQPVQLVFRQILSQINQNPVTLQAADSSVIDRGIAYVKETKETVTQAASSIMNKIGGLF